MTLPTPPNFNNPIPNNPFYSPESYFITGWQGCLILSSSWTISPNGTISAGGGGSGGVSQILAGSGIAISPSTGTGVVTICSTASGAVSKIIAGQGIIVDPSTGLGNVTVCGSAATPVALGLLLGCTTPVSANTSLGYNAGKCVISGLANTALGYGALLNNTIGCNNTAVGNSALGLVTGGCNNVALGAGAGSNITVGCNNVAIGNDVQVLNPLANNQLAIGYDAGCTWILGDSNLNVRFGAGIRDCTNNLGAAGQVLTSTSTGIQWTTSGVNVCLPLTSTGGANPTLCVNNASIVAPGVVQLYNATNSLSTSLALTAAQGKSLQDQINALLTSSNTTLAGTFNPSTGLLQSVTSEGSSAGFAVGSPLPAAASGNSSYFVLAVSSGSYNPPGGGGPYNVTQGDWMLSNGTNWEYLNVGIDITNASTTSAGIVQLDNGFTSVSQTTAPTSNALTQTYNLACAAIPCACLNAQGVLLSATAPGVPSQLALGTNGQVLTVNTACANGLEWKTNPALGVQTVTAVAPINSTGGTNPVITASLASTSAAGVVQLNDTVISTSTTLAGTANSVKCAYDLAANAISKSTLTGKGALVTASSAGNPVALPVGSDNQVLVADSTCPGGLKWFSESGIPCACITGKGVVLTGTAAGAPIALPAGADGQVVTACAACSSGLTWIYPLLQAVVLLNTDCGIIGGPITTTGTICLSNTGVTAGTYSYPTITVDAQGRISSATSCTPVTCICTSTGLTGGPINSTGTIALANTPVTPGIYTYATVTVDQQGRLTQASSGTQPVALNQYTAKGDILAGISPGVPLKVSVGADGTVLTADSNCIAGVKWSPAAAGTVTNVTGNTPIQVVNNTTTPAISVSTATATTCGVVITCDSTSSTCAAANGFAASPLAVSTLAGNVICKAALTAKGAILTATGVSTPVALPVGTDGQVLVACSLSTNGLCWLTTPAAIPCSTLTAKGAIVTASAASTPTALTVGTDGQILYACSTAATGLCWAAAPAAGIPSTCITAKGTLISGTAANTPTALAVGTDSFILTACAACATGLTWAPPAIATPLTYGAVLGCTYAVAGNCSTALGWCTGIPTAGAQNVMIGTCALRSVGAGNSNLTAVGVQAGANIGAAATDDVIIGYNTVPNLNGSGNVFVGNCIAPNLATNGASQLTIVGHQALGAAGVATAGQGNTQTVIGYRAGYCSVGIENTFVGVYAGAANTGTRFPRQSVAIGTCALYSAGDSYGNIAIGHCSAACLTTGINNVTIGCCAGYQITSGFNNVLVGCMAGCSLTTGCCNTMIGEGAGAGTVGDCNIFIGTGTTIAGSSTRNIRIGGGSAAFNNAFVFASAWTYSSDERSKAIDPAGVPYGLDWINQVKPIAYKWCDRETGEYTSPETHYGFSAQQLASLETTEENVIVDKKSNPDFWGISTNDMLPIFVNAIKELTTELRDLKKEFEDYKASHP